MDDLDTAPPRSYLLKGLISLGEVSIWVGAPKCGKSFLLLYVAYMLSLARPVFGRRVKPTKVLYVAAEGEAGIANRIKALRGAYGPSPDFHYIAQPIDLLRDAGHKIEVIDAATAHDAQLIVIDTLNRALAGGDENGPQDMGTLITNVSHIKAQTGAHIAIIHHGTKSSGGGKPRGHGSLAGADDAQIEVRKLDDGSRAAYVEHCKDDADGMTFTFKLDVVTLGIDNDGDPITTLIATEVPADPASAGEPSGKPKQAPLSDSEQIVLACLDRAFKTDAITATVGEDHSERPVVPIVVWRTRYHSEARPADDDPKAKQQAFRRAVDRLTLKGRVACQDGFVWRPDIW
jgi:hypothetical protein